MSSSGFDPQMHREYPGHHALAEWERYFPRRSSGPLLAGLAVVGLGALAWHYFGPDVMRYLKIRNMV